MRSAPMEDAPSLGKSNPVPYLFVSFSLREDIIAIVIT